MGAGNFDIGSFSDEPDRHKDEVRHRVTLTKPLAMLDREITMEELIAFNPMYESFLKQVDGKPGDACFSANWYEAVGFCRWLGQQAGFSEKDQAYAAPGSLDEESYPRESTLSANVTM